MKAWINKLSRHRPAGPIRFSGDYASWEEALRKAKGYDSPVILEKTLAATLKLKRGEAGSERDAVLFDETQHPFPVIAGLLRMALKRGGHLVVADFGGSLGNSYYQCRGWLRKVAPLEWLVIERPDYVACGRQHFENEELRFYETMEECLKYHRPSVLLASSVLQYLPDPFAALRGLLRHGLDNIIVDRTAFLESERSRLTLQAATEASYPAWFLSETKLRATFSAAGYELYAEFSGTDNATLAGDKAAFKGFIYDRQGTV